MMKGKWEPDVAINRARSPSGLRPNEFLEVELLKTECPPTLSIQAHQRERQGPLDLVDSEVPDSTLRTGTFNC